jgi:hypothetical protein
MWQGHRVGLWAGELLLIFLLATALFSPRVRWDGMCGDNSEDLKTPSGGRLECHWRPPAALMAGPGASDSWLKHASHL